MNCCTSLKVSKKACNPALLELRDFERSECIEEIKTNILNYFVYFSCSAEFSDGIFRITFFSRISWRDLHGFINI